MKTGVSSLPVAGAASTSTSPPIATGTSKRRCFGLLTRKERWGLSLRGWLLAVALLAGTACAFLFGAHAFLAVSDRVPTSVLVVEGWVHEYAIRAAVEEFHGGGYQLVFTTGGPTPGLGNYVNDAQTSASVGAEALRSAGIAAEVLQMVPSRVLGRDRTYTSAVALREWFRTHQLPVRSINVMTEDAHARRTRLLFEKAFGSDVQVGIISIPNPAYDAHRWWRYSEGVREVFSETVAYLYARFLFHPDAPAPEP